MEIGETIEKVAKLVFFLNTNNKVRSRYARTVYINLDRPLISQVIVNGMTQKVEYEFLPIVCFRCGKYGHNKDLCTNGVEEGSTEKTNLGSK